MDRDAITFVGLDAHKKAVNVAMLMPGQRTPIEWQVANEPTALRRLARKLEREAVGTVRSCYEAGPLGYGLQRQLGLTALFGVHRPERREGLAVELGALAH